MGSSLTLAPTSMRCGGIQGTRSGHTRSGTPSRTPATVRVPIRRSMPRPAVQDTVTAGVSSRQTRDGVLRGYLPDRGPGSTRPVRVRADHVGGAVQTRRTARGGAAVPILPLRAARRPPRAVAGGRLQRSTCARCRREHMPKGADAVTCVGRPVRQITHPASKSTEAGRDSLYTGLLLHFLQHPTADGVHVVSGDGARVVQGWGYPSDPTPSDGWTNDPAAVFAARIPLELPGVAGLAGGTPKPVVEVEAQPEPSARPCGRAATDKDHIHRGQPSTG